MNERISTAAWQLIGRLYERAISTVGHKSPTMGVRITLIGDSPLGNEFLADGRSRKHTHLGYVFPPTDVAETKKVVELFEHSSAVLFCIRTVSDSTTFDDYKTRPLLRLYVEIVGVDGSVRDVCIDALNAELGQWADEVVRFMGYDLSLRVKGPIA